MTLKNLKRLKTARCGMTVVVNRHKMSQRGHRRPRPIRPTNKRVALERNPALSITRLLARGSDPARVISALHQIALDEAGAAASVLLRPDPTSGQWTAVSGAGLETLTLGPWLATAPGAEAAGRALSRDRPLVLTSLDTDVPELAALLGTPTAVLVPLVGAEQAVGLLVLALPPGVSPDVDRAATAWRRDGHRARPRTHRRRTGTPPRRSGSDGGLCPRRRLAGHAASRARGDVSWGRAAHRGRRRRAVATRSTGARTGAGGHIGPAASRRRNRRSLPPT